MATVEKYKPEFIEQARKLCELGATDREMAAFFRIGEKTFYRWRLKYPEFAAALRVGKEKADARVERCLYQLATGYQQKSVKIFCNKDGHVTEVPYVEAVAPDTTACIFWLKNRKPAEWRDLKAIEHSGKLTHTHVADLTDEQLVVIAASNAADSSAGATETPPGTPEPPAVH